MGPSGAGKTTVLNVISGRLWKGSGKTEDIWVDGDVKINGRRVNHRVDILRRLVAFVEQDDVFPGFLTVQEHLWFHAKLRMTSIEFTDSHRKERIDKICRNLNLKHVENSKIGVPEVGLKTLSGGERKRLSVAVELISNPPLLILDEPTTGLDSFMSESVLSSLKVLAQEGKTVAFTIHQPSSELFTYFDRLLLLSEGRVCYHGDAQGAEIFFSEHPINSPCPLNFNPADFYLDLLSKPLHKNYDHQQMDDHAKFLSETFSSSQFGVELAEDIEKESNENGNIEEFASGTVGFSNLFQPTASGFEQLKWCSWRAALTFHRSPHWIRIRMIWLVIFSVLYVLLYFNLSTTPTGVSDRNGLLAQLVSLNVWDNIDAYALSLPLERPFLLRDEAAGLYTLNAYFFGRQFVELPLIFFLSAIQTCLVAGLTGLWSISSVQSAFEMLATCFLTGLNASSMGYFIGFMSSSVSLQLGFRIIVLQVMCTLNGYWLNITTVPVYLTWLVYSSFFYWANEAVFISEWGKVTHLDCPNSTETMRCFKDGNEVLESFGFGDYSRLWLDLVVLVANAIFWRGLSLLLLYWRFYGSIWLATVRRRLTGHR